MAEKDSNNFKKKTDTRERRLGADYDDRTGEEGVFALAGVMRCWA